MKKQKQWPSGPPNKASHYLINIVAVIIAAYIGKSFVQAVGFEIGFAVIAIGLVAWFTYSKLKNKNKK